MPAIDRELDLDFDWVAYHCMIIIAPIHSTVRKQILPYPRTVSVGR